MTGVFFSPSYSNHDRVEMQVHSPVDIAAPDTALYPEAANLQYEFSLTISSQ
jgi:hypothetical protein